MERLNLKGETLNLGASDRMHGRTQIDERSIALSGLNYLEKTRGVELKIMAKSKKLHLSIFALFNDFREIDLMFGILGHSLWSPLELAGRSAQSIYEIKPESIMNSTKKNALASKSSHVKKATQAKDSATKISKATQAGASAVPKTSGRGGARVGAGRKPGSGQYKEPTTVKRIPESLLIPLEQWLTEHKKRRNAQVSSTALPKDAMFVVPNPPSLRIPVAQDAVRAGLPASASPDISDYLDFNTYLVNNPTETIAVYVKGDSMAKVGIFEGDMLVVDRSVEAHHRDIVLANLDDEFTVKRMIKTSQGVELHPENDDYPIIRPGSESMLSIVGVVLYSIKKTW